MFLQLHCKFLVITFNSIFICSKDDYITIIVIIAVVVVVVYSIAKDEINCTTERLVLVHNDIDVDTNVSTATLPACGEIFIVINNATLKSESSVRFCYYNDPDISSITPRRTIER